MVQACVPLRSETQLQLYLKAQSSLLARVERKASGRRRVFFQVSMCLVCLKQTLSYIPRKITTTRDLLQNKLIPLLPKSLLRFEFPVFQRLTFGNKH